MFVSYEALDILVPPRCKTLRVDLGQPPLAIPLLTKIRYVKFIDNVVAWCPA